MLIAVLTCMIIAIVASFSGLGGIAGSALGIAWVLAIIGIVKSLIASATGPGPSL